MQPRGLFADNSASTASTVAGPRLGITIAASGRPFLSATSHLRLSSAFDRDRQDFDRQNLTRTHTITSSARASSAGGNAMSEDFSAFRLTTNSTFVDC